MNAIRLHNDIPFFWDAWDIFDYALNTHNDILAHSFETLEVSKDSVEIQFKYKISESSSITQKIKFYSCSARIDFQTNADWHENRKLLKVYFPLQSIRSDFATFATQFGQIRRPTHSNTSWDQSKHEVCGHNYCSISEPTFGAAVLSTYKYGFSCKNNVIGLSLLKSAKKPNDESDMGLHDFTYGFIAHSTLKQAEEASIQLSYPILTYQINAADDEELNSEFITINQPNIYLDAFKLAEDSSGHLII